MAIDNRLYLIYNYVEEITDGIYLVENPDGIAKGANGQLVNIPLRTADKIYNRNVASLEDDERRQFLLLNSDLEVITECDGAQKRKIHKGLSEILDVNCGRVQMELKTNGDRIIPYKTKTANIAPNGVFSCKLNSHWQKKINGLKSLYITSGFVDSSYRLYNGFSFIYKEDFDKQHFYTNDDILFCVFGQSKKSIYGYVLRPKIKGLCDYPKMILNSSTMELGFISIKDINSILYKVRFDTCYKVGCTDIELVNLIKNRSEPEPNPANKRTLLAIMGVL